MLRKNVPIGNTIYLNSLQAFAFHFTNFKFMIHYINFAIFFNFEMLTSVGHNISIESQYN